MHNNEKSPKNAGRTRRRNNKLRKVAAHLGITVRAARRLRAADPSKKERRIKQGTSDSNWIRAKLGYTRADGSLQHIGGVTKSHRRQTSEKQQLFDLLLKVDVPRLQKRLESANRRLGTTVSQTQWYGVDVNSADESSMPRQQYDTAVTQRITAIIKLAAPDPSRTWRTFLAAAILCDQNDGKSGWGAYSRGLKELRKNESLMQKLATETGIDIS